MFVLLRYFYVVLFQDPSDGFYKVRFNNTTDISDPIRVIGDVKECNCYGHSNRCNSETGVCQVKYLMLIAYRKKEIYQKMPISRNLLAVLIVTTRITKFLTSLRHVTYQTNRAQE